MVGMRSIVIGEEESVLDTDRGSTSGAALVEFAILAPLLIMLLFGIVTAGLAFNNALALSHAAREAGRHAATLPVSNFADLDAWLDAVKTQVITDSDGSLADGVAGRQICVAYVHPAGSLSTDVTRRVSRDASGTDTYADATCLADGRPNTERRVQITVERDADLNVILFSTTVTLDSQSVNRFEAGLGG